MTLKTTLEILGSIDMSCKVASLPQNYGFVSFHHSVLANLVADAREAHRLHAALQVSAAENLNKEEATRGIMSAATPPPDAHDECPDCAANHEASEHILKLARETLGRRDIHGYVEGAEALAKQVEMEQLRYQNAKKVFLLAECSAKIAALEEELGRVNGSPDRT